MPVIPYPENLDLTRQSFVSPELCHLNHRAEIDFILLHKVQPGTAAKDGETGKFRRQPVRGRAERATADECD